MEEQSIKPREIAGNINQSTMTSNDVVKNITGISRSTQDGSKNAVDLSSLAMQLKGLFSRLETMVKCFGI